LEIAVELPQTFSKEAVEKATCSLRCLNQKRRFKHFNLPLALSSGSGLGFPLHLDKRVSLLKGSPSRFV
jgi:hypothetical protein